MTVSTSGAVGYPRRGWGFAQSLGRAAMRLTGWRFNGTLPEIPKYVLIVAPHTSNWDFPVGLAAMFALDLEARWFMKDSMFRGPLDRLFRSMGGRPIHRGTSEGVVAEVAGMIRTEPHFILAIAPEGTRKQVKEWRSGFYRIAEAAGVPIVPVRFDFSRREIGIGAPMQPTGDLAADVVTLKALFTPDMARNPGGFWAKPAPK